MQIVKEQLIVWKDDYEVIMTHLKQGLGRNTFNRQDAEELQAELKKAKLVNKAELPGDVVRLNSVVTVKDEKENRVLKVEVVTPEKANIRQRKISILSPIGTALIGFRKGRKVKWNVPAGKKTFIILDVENAFQ
jgi:regulator of nucleoside diphosphate kinase